MWSLSGTELLPASRKHWFPYLHIVLFCECLLLGHQRGNFSPFTPYLEPSHLFLRHLCIPSPLFPQSTIHPLWGKGKKGWDLPNREGVKLRTSQSPQGWEILVRQNWSLLPRHWASALSPTQAGLYLEWHHLCPETMSRPFWLRT